MNKCQCSERSWGAVPSAWSGSKKRGSTKTESLSIDPVPGEPEGAAGVETRRSRKRSRATPHLPQVSLCSVRSGREGHSGVPMSHLLFLCLCWRLDWNSSRFPLVFVLSQCDSIMSHSKDVWGCAYPLSLFICQAQSVLLTVVSLCVPQISPSPLWGASPGGEPFPLHWRRGSQGGLGGLLAPTVLPVRAWLQVGKFSCACRSAPPTLETMRPKQEWEMRLNRIRMTKQSVRVSSC